MIRWDRVAELREEVGEDDFAEVVELFLEEVEGVLDRLKTTPQKEKLEEDLHFVKGSALTLGFAVLSDICLAGERKAAAADYEGIDIDAVRSVYDLSKAEFIARLA